MSPQKDSSKEVVMPDKSFRLVGAKYQSVADLALAQITQHSVQFVAILRFGIII